ncbi:MAG TPA: dual specificity protein phosphatase family protein [Terriglobales bacterium]|jgi:protein-tyrosine phosphatase
MSTKLYWIHGPWAGKLAVAARPRGGDWLEDEISSWRRSGVDTVLSLLDAEEELELNLKDEAKEAKLQGMKFFSLPIPDRQVPSSEAKLTKTLEALDADLQSGKNLAVHCRQGIGRSGLIATCLLIRKGFSPQAAVEIVSAARGVNVPETAEQRNWLDRYALVSETTR